MGPWQPHLELGVVHFMAFPECLGGDGPLFDSLCEIAYDDFFDAVDVGPMNDAAQRRECASLLRDCRMTVTFACQPVQLRLGLDLNAADRTARKFAAETVLGLVDQAVELGAGRFALMSGKNVPLDRRAGAIDALVNELCGICRSVKARAGLPVVMEIFDHDLDKKALVGACLTAAEVAKAVRREFPDFGLLHDLSHIYICHEEPATHLPLIREQLVAVHMGSSVRDKNHPLFGDSHPLFGMSGGDCDVPQLREFLRVLFDIGFLRPGRRPVCGFEVKPPAGVAPRTAVANMKRTWNCAWWTLDQGSAFHAPRL